MGPALIVALPSPVSGCDWEPLVCLSTQDMQVAFADSFDAQREKMINYHLLSRGIQDAWVIKVMREAFVDKGMAYRAYERILLCRWGQRGSFLG